jgi:protein SCO1/2
MLNHGLKLCLAALMLVAGISCSKKPEPQTNPVVLVGSTNLQTFQVRGVIVELSASGKTVRIRHEEIPDYMPAMTMPFDVRDTNELAGFAAGDTVIFQMKVTETDGWIEQIKKTAVAAAQTNILPAGATMRIGG